MDWRNYQTIRITNLYRVCLLSIQKDWTSNKVAVLLYNTFKKGNRKGLYAFKLQILAFRNVRDYTTTYRPLYPHH
jgi:hypothetical protein